VPLPASSGWLVQALDKSWKFSLGLYTHAFMQCIHEPYRSSNWNPVAVLHAGPRMLHGDKSHPMYTGTCAPTTIGITKHSGLKNFNTANQFTSNGGTAGK
jgi:hypothetical protein